MRDTRFKIGTVAKLTGLSPFLLRAWENRYDLLKPRRSETGLRFYTEGDVELLKSIKLLLDRGYTIGEVATWGPERILGETGPGEATKTPAREAPGLAQPGMGLRDSGRAALFTSVRARLLDAVDHLDRAAFESTIAEASALAPFDALMAGVLLPFLDEIGGRWVRGETTIAGEHFATAAVRQRLVTMIQATSPATGPLAILACAPDDYHDIGALYACYQLAREGWAVTYLGANLPVAELAAAVSRKRPALVGLSVTLSVPRKRIREWLETLGAACPPGARRVCGGAGAREHADLVASLGFDLDSNFEVTDRRKTQV